MRNTFDQPSGFPNGSAWRYVRGKGVYVGTFVDEPRPPKSWYTTGIGAGARAGRLPPAETCETPVTCGAENVIGFILLWVFGGTEPVTGWGFNTPTGVDRLVRSNS
jgi:hypothetical protein